MKIVLMRETASGTEIWIEFRKEAAQIGDLEAALQEKVQVNPAVRVQDRQAEPPAAVTNLIDSAKGEQT